MNQQQLFAYENPNESKNGNQLIRLKGLLLSSAITIELLDNDYLWHASITVISPVSQQLIHANKVSYGNKLRIRRELQKLLEGVGSGEDSRSESQGSFHLFRQVSKVERPQLDISISKERLKN